MADDLHGPFNSEAASVDSETANDEKKVPATSTIQEVASPEHITQRDPNVVDWDSPNDPQNPLNWSEKRKWTTIALISSLSMMVSLGPTIFAPSVPSVLAEFGSTNHSIGSFLVSVYVIGNIFGPLVLVPLGEHYGRSIVTHAANVGFLVFSILCAVSVDIPMIIVFRLCTGLAASVPVTLGGGFIFDLMPPERRGTAFTIWSCGPTLGPVIAPLMGGYITMKLGWRWTLWINAIGVSCTLFPVWRRDTILTAKKEAFLVVLAALFLRETYEPQLLHLKAKRLRKSTGNPHLRSKHDNGETVLNRILTAIIRPSKIIIRSPIALILALTLAVAYAYMYLFFTTFTTVFENQYGFNPGEAGLAYLGLGGGFTVAQIALMAFMDPYMRAQKTRSGVYKPEYRLPPLIVGITCIPIGLIWYGWAVEAHTHWLLPIVGTGFVGIGIMFVFSPVLLYLVDAFQLYAASAIAASTVVRSVFGAVLPLAGPPMYASMGLGWGNTMLALICIGMIPFVLLIMKYGERIRTSPRFQPRL